MVNNDEYKKLFKKVLFTEEEILQKVNECAKWITNYFIGKRKDEIVIIPILNGAINFCSYLMLGLRLKFKLDYYSIESYRQKISIPKMIKDIDVDVSNKHVVIIENVIESGRTMEYIIEDLKNKNVNEITIVTLIDKPSKRKVDIKPHYSCFTTNESNIVGWGLDYKGKYRNLPFIAVFKEE